MDLVFLKMTYFKKNIYVNHNIIIWWKFSDFSTFFEKLLFEIFQKMFYNKHLISSQPKGMGIPFAHWFKTFQDHNVMTTMHEFQFISIMIDKVNDGNKKEKYCTNNHYPDNITMYLIKNKIYLLLNKIHSQDLCNIWNVIDKHNKMWSLVFFIKQNFKQFFYRWSSWKKKLQF